jgi:hypothetical protein
VVAISSGRRTPGDDAFHFAKPFENQLLIKLKCSIVFQVDGKYYFLSLLMSLSNGGILGQAGASS